MVRARVVAVLEDGTKQEAEGAFATLPDRVLFESYFGISAVVMGELDQDHPDPKVLREEWVAFLSWRLLCRKGALHDPGNRAPAPKIREEFLEWLETIEDEIEIELEGDEELPKAPDDGPLTESSPSSPSTGT